MQRDERKEPEKNTGKAVSPTYTEAMEHLVGVVRDLSLARDLEAVMAIVRRAARDLTGADGATFVLREGDQCFYAEENAIAPLWKGRRFPMSVCISGWVMLNRQPAVIEDIYSDSRIPAEAYRPTFVKSLAMVPIRTNDPVGAIGTYWAERRQPGPEQVKILAALADTTAVALENVRIFEELRRKNQDMTALMQAAPIGVVSLGADARPLVWNPAAASLFGDPITVTDWDSLSGIAGESAEDYCALIRDLRQGRVVRGRSLTGRRADGGAIDLRLSGAPVFNEDGGLRAMLLLAEDETERNRFERQFLHMQKMEAIGQLTDGIAHDFNNLLGVLIGNLDLLRERLESDAEGVELVDAALQAGVRGAELNKRLLAFSRRQALQPETVEVNTAVSDMVRLLRRSLGERVEVRLVCGAGLWPVLVDPVQLETAVMNLCVNARDAMPQGGMITIETGNVAIDPVYAAAHEELSPGDYVVLTLSDNGTGMPPEVLERVFEPFFTTKPVGRGTGLGLSMVYGFMKQSGGHINIYSEAGRGTTVRLYLPRAASAGRRASAPVIVARGADQADGRLALVVEDNPDMRRVAAQQLADMGFRVAEVENADKAVAAVAEGLRPDLLFADIIMPGTLDGLDLADRLRGTWPALPVLLTSGFSERMVHDALTRDEGDGGAGLYPVLSKPYRKDDLHRSVRQVMADAKQRGGA